MGVSFRELNWDFLKLFAFFHFGEGLGLEENRK